MIEKGSRKTAPPDTARVKVHRYNLQIKSKAQNRLKTVLNKITVSCNCLHVLMNFSV